MATADPFGQYQQLYGQPTYDANALYQSAYADPASQFRPGRVGVRASAAMPATQPQAAPGQAPPAAGGAIGRYFPQYDMNAIWQQAMSDPMSQFRPGRVGVRGFGTFTPPSVGGGGGNPAQPAPATMPQLGNFYTPYSPGDAQNLPTSTVGSNFLGGYTTRKRDA